MRAECLGREESSKERKPGKAGEGRKGISEAFKHPQTLLKSSLCSAAGSAAPHGVTPSPPGPSTNLGGSGGSGSTESSSNTGSSAASEPGRDLGDPGGAHDALLGEGAEDGPGDCDHHRGRVNDHGGVRALPDAGLVAGIGHGLGHGHAAGRGAAVGAGAQGANHGSGVICGAREEQENKTNQDSHRFRGQA